jgi:hypothetical protein
LAGAKKSLGDPPGGPSKFDPAQAGLALQNSPADSDRSQPAVSSHHAEGFRSSLRPHIGEYF